ncbi:hypothetical protein DERP_011505 [Dermatophagoides pteronyssinus]|uniref:Uncharacterized protein n=1 Tax=Dermatophagoides pteronyssinus TaxID=6956 RepID=A0ABQ8JC32_DERPT|nr:hypothetical protein DERP_011505 [Dermatophagoides pteronyssinus]
MSTVNNDNNNNRLINLLKKYFNHQFDLKPNDIIQPNHMIVIKILQMIINKFNDDDDDDDACEQLLSNNNNYYNDFDFNYKSMNELVKLLKNYCPFNQSSMITNNNNNDYSHNQQNLNHSIVNYIEFDLYQLIFQTKPNGRSFQNLLNTLCQAKKLKHEKQMLLEQYRTTIINLKELRQKFDECRQYHFEFQSESKRLIEINNFLQQKLIERKKYRQQLTEQNLQIINKMNDTIRIDGGKK